MRSSEWPCFQSIYAGFVPTGVSVAKMDLRPLFAAIAVLAALAWGALHVQSANAAVIHGLRGTYYNDTTLKHPVFTRTDARIAFAWKLGSPSKRIGRDTFGVRWEGSIDAPATGTYTLSLRASDGVRMWIDGKQRLRRWARAADPRESSVALRLAKGRHAIRVDYFESTGAASAVLYWQGPHLKKQVVPSARLFPPPAPEAPAKPWSDPATWEGAVPQDNTSVTIPAGMSVLLDRDVSLANLTVLGTLVFARRDVTLEADWIMVEGKLQIGTAAAPFQQQATIRLRDMTPNENIMNVGDKVIGVMGGTLDLFGQQRTGWTKLDATAARGADHITLATAPGWRVGDRIAITSTDFAQSQAEEATITAISGVNVTLDHALKYQHFGTLQSFAHRQVDERAEVALLSRNVTVEGESTSSADGFGAQIMVMNGGAAHVNGAQLQRVGQAGILRRYPIHFHMLGDAAAGSYIVNSSVHHSNNRCITVHGSNQVHVAGNVCFDHKGHGIFLEDGAEHDNVIENNLVFGTHAPAENKRLLASDGTPGSYWITNPDNIVRGNVAAGSEGHGFWIALPEHPTGFFAKTFPDQTAAMWNRRTALTEFSGNTAHSNGGDGLHFDDGPKPDGTTESSSHHAYQDPTDTKSKTLVTKLTGFTSYKNRDEGAWLRGVDHTMTGAVLADNGIGATFASNESFLQDSLIVGESSNVGTPEQWEVHEGGVGRNGRSAPRPWEPDFPIRGFEFYDGRVGVERTTFVNFQPWTAPGGANREQSALGYKLDNDFSIDPANFANALTFVNAKQLYLPTPSGAHDGELSAAFLDADGSVTGTAGRRVMVRNPFLFGLGCALQSAWNAELCNGDYATLLVGAPGSRASLRPLTVTRGDGQVQTLTASTEDGGAENAATSVLTNAAYSLAFTGGTPASTSFVLAHGRDRWIRVAVPMAEGYRVLRYGCNVATPGSWCSAAYGSLAALTAGTRSGFWYDNGGDGDPATGTLHLKLNSKDTDWDELTVER